MTATNMCSNFGGKWDSPPNQKNIFPTLNLTLPSQIMMGEFFFLEWFPQL